MGESVDAKLNRWMGKQYLRIQARSSVGEHYLDTVGVVGSIPTVPTII